MTKSKGGIRKADGVEKKEYLGEEVKIMEKQNSNKKNKRQTLKRKRKSTEKRKRLSSEKTKKQVVPGWNKVISKVICCCWMSILNILCIAILWSI